MTRENLGQVGQKVLAWLLWLITSGVGLIEVYLFRQISTEILFRLGVKLSALDAIGWGIVLISALLWVGYFIAGLEHLLKQTKGKIAWSLFAWASSIELLILILYFVLPT